MSDNLEIEEPEYKQQKKQSKKTEEIEFSAYSDKSQKSIGLQSMLQSLIEILIVRD